MIAAAERNTDDSEDNIPEMYVSTDILKPMALSHPERTPPILYDKVYEINGSIFRDDISRENESLSYFEVSTADGEKGVTIHEVLDVYLPVFIQECAYGIIINSNVLLTVEQWNTVVARDDDGHKCIVCDTVICDTLAHVNSEMHLRNMERNQPLKIHDLSVTRLINGIYHCGVCNKCFDEDQLVQHFDGKAHIKKMLFALNRATDVIYDFEMHGVVISKNDDNGRTPSEHSRCRSTPLSFSDTSGFDSDSADFLYDDDSEYDNNGYGVVESNHTSYAAIAKKASATPEYILITLDGKKMKMKFDHWHMLSTFTTNQLYCMVCRVYCHVTQKGQHCAGTSHLYELKRYKFVEEHQHCYIRQIDKTYYHCGRCNNLQLISEINNHITTRHSRVIRALHPEGVPKRNKNNDNNTTRNRNGSNDKNFALPSSCHTTRNSTNDDVKNQADQASGNANNDKKNTRNEHNETDATNAKNMCNESEQNPNSFNDIVLYLYGFRIRVSLFAYNVVCTGPNGMCFCYICLVEFGYADVTGHINSPLHIEKLNRIKFEDNLGINLIRKVNFQNHCTICHVFVNVEQPNIHVLHRSHVDFLTKALTENNQHKQYHPINYSNQLPINQPPNGMNHVPITHPAMVMNQTAMPQSNDFMYQPPMLHPEIPLNVWPMLPIKMSAPQYAFMPSTSDLNQRAMNQQQINTNQRNPTTNQSKTCPSQPTTEQTKINMLQRTTILPINEHRTHVEQSDTKSSEENKNQDKNNNKESNTEANQPKTQNIDSKLESIGDMLVDLNESLDDADDGLNYFNEKFVYLKFKSTYIKVGLASHNGLVKIGDGSSYCFVCSETIYNSLKKHVESKNHVKCMTDCLYIRQYEKHLLRQIRQNYHCSVCNIIFAKKYINKHITWPIHLDGKKIGRSNVKCESKTVNIKFKNESIFHEKHESEIKVLIRIDSKQNDNYSNDDEEIGKYKKKNKIIIYKETIFKITWDSYHGIIKQRGVNWCAVCACEVKEYELTSHARGDGHREPLDRFEPQHLPDLVRKVNDTKLNCVICNTEIFCKPQTVKEHIDGRKHKGNYLAKLVDKSSIDTDCNDDILYL